MKYGHNNHSDSHNNHSDSHHGWFMGFVKGCCLTWQPHAKPSAAQPCQAPRPWTKQPTAAARSSTVHTCRGRCSSHMQSQLPPHGYRRQAISSTHMCSTLLTPDYLSQAMSNMHGQAPERTHQAISSVHM